MDTPSRFETVIVLRVIGAIQSACTESSRFRCLQSTDGVSLQLPRTAGLIHRSTTWLRSSDSRWCRWPRRVAWRRLLTARRTLLLILVLRCSTGTVSVVRWGRHSTWRNTRPDTIHYSLLFQKCVKAPQIFFHKLWSNYNESPRLNSFFFSLSLSFYQFETFCFPSLKWVSESSSPRASPGSSVVNAVWLACAPIP